MRIKPQDAIAVLAMELASTIVERDRALAELAALRAATPKPEATED